MYGHHNYEERLNIVSRILSGETINIICRKGIKVVGVMTFYHCYRCSRNLCKHCNRHIVINQCFRYSCASEGIDSEVIGDQNAIRLSIGNGLYGPEHDFVACSMNDTVPDH